MVFELIKFYILATFLTVASQLAAFMIEEMVLKSVFVQHFFTAMRAWFLGHFTGKSEVMHVIVVFHYLLFWWTMAICDYCE